MSEQDIFLKSVQSLREDDFTKEVLIPLFFKLGYFDVHFNGGVVEEGKDLIALKKADFGGYDVTVVQAKKISKKGEISKDAVHRYMMQLNQCLKKTIKYKDGREYLPSKVYFATPFIISSRIVREQFESIENSDGKLSVIDGAQIYDQVKRLAPEILDKFISSPEDRISASVKELQNIELLKALRASEEPVKEVFYSDLDFFVGKADSNTILNNSIRVLSRKYNLTKSKWIKLRKHLQRMGDTGMMHQSVDDVESKYSDWDEMYRSKVNFDLKRRVAEIDAEMQSYKESLGSFLSDEKTKIDLKISKAVDNKQKRVLRENKVKIDFVRSDVASFDFELMSGLKDDLALLGSNGVINPLLLGQLGSSLQSMERLAIEKNDKEKKVIPEPEYLFQIDAESIEAWWGSTARWYRGFVKKINDACLSSEEIKRFLDEIRGVLSVINSMIAVNDDCGRFFSLDASPPCDDRISVSIQAIFNTGVNAALYGEAGAGKTTTLQVYSKNEIERGESNKNVYYFPLNRIVSSKISVDRDKFNELRGFEKFFLYLLFYRSVNNPIEKIEETVSAVASSNRSVFIFDGIDEAIKVAPWIIKAINEFPKIFQGCQVIVSSRDCVQYIDEIDFVGLTLLPFNENQVDRFVHGWIDNDVEAKEVLRKLKERDIIQVVKNPLLATIVCSLYKKGIDIPRSEIEVYRKRIKLLCGMYDNFKSVQRTKNAQDDLEEAAKKIAFSLHSKELRQASRSEIIKFLVGSSHGKYTYSLAESLVNELVDPCNVLKKTPLEDAYGFGHLRFQEHLCAEEIMRNRDFDLVGATRFDWWSGVLYLYASENPVDSLIDDIYQRYGTLAQSEVCLMKMVSAKSNEERKDIGALIGELIKQDNFVLDEDDVHEYDYDDSFSYGIGRWG